MRIRSHIRLQRRKLTKTLVVIKNHLLLRSRYFSLGARGERTARAYLERNHYLIWEMNHRSKLGEIDIICSIGRTLVFVEVKTRSQSSAAFPTIMAVNKIKQERIRRAGQFFLQEHIGLLRRRRTLRVRFDVIILEGNPGLLRRFSIRHLEGAITGRKEASDSRESQLKWSTGFSL